MVKSKLSKKRLLWKIGSPIIFLIIGIIISPSLTKITLQETNNTEMGIDNLLLCSNKLSSDRADIFVCEDRTNCINVDTTTPNCDFKLFRTGEWYSLETNVEKVWIKFTHQGLEVKRWGWEHRSWCNLFKPFF